MSDESLENPIEQFRDLMSEKGVESSLKSLADYFRSTRQYAELFEVLKADIRLSMDLPLISDAKIDHLDETTQRCLEDRLLVACQEIGSAFLKHGQISQAWVYLQPLPDRGAIKQAFEALEVTDENSSEFLDIALYAGAAPESGYRLLLSEQGTCNGITFYDTQANYLDTRTQIQLAEILVEHIYSELTENLRSIISEQENSPSPEQPLSGLIQRQWLFENCGHHLDVTHLAAAVRIARRCDAEPAIQRSLELCVYGTKLDQQLHYPGEFPFENTYSDHQQYFQGLLGRELENAIDHFRSKLRDEGTAEESMPVKEVIVELLDKNNRSTEAIAETLTCSPEFIDMARLIGLAKNDHDHQLIMQHFKDQGETLGYCLTVVGGAIDKRN